MRGSVAVRLEARTDRTGECWIFTGGRQGRGYGYLWTPDRGMQLAHRVAWELEHGPIPDELTIDHTCEVKACVRVAHLQLVTRAENQRLRWTRLAERKAAA